MKESKYQPVFYTVWQDAYLALTQPRQYLIWAFQPFWRSLKYLFILSAVISIVSTVYFFINIRPFIQEFQVWVSDTVPQVAFTDSHLAVADDETFSFTDSDQFYFKVDPTVSLEDEPSIDAFYEVGLLLIEDGAVLRSNGTVEQIPYEEFGLNNFSFDGPSLSAWIENYVLKFAIVIVPILVFIYLIISKLIFSAFFSFLFFLFSGFRLNYVHVWSMAVYALTPAMLAGYVSFIFGPIVGLYSIVFLIYLTLAVGNYRRFTEAKQIKKDNSN